MVMQSLALVCLIYKHFRLFWTTYLPCCSHLKTLAVAHAQQVAPFGLCCQDGTHWTSLYKQLRGHVWSVLALTCYHNTTLRTKENSLFFECCLMLNLVGIWGLHITTPHVLKRYRAESFLLLHHTYSPFISLTLSVVTSADNFMQNFNYTSEQFIGFRHSKDLFIISHFPLKLSCDRWH